MIFSLIINYKELRMRGFTLFYAFFISFLRQINIALWGGTVLIFKEFCMKDTKTNVLKWYSLLVLIIIAVMIAFSSCDTKTSIPIEMLSIPAGTFIMGSPDTEQDRNSDETQHSVTLSSFYMSKHEITQAQWIEVMGSRKALPKTNYGKGNNYPVYNVSWYDTLVFCNKLSMKEGLSPAYSINGSTDPAQWGTIPTDRDETWDTVAIIPNSIGYRLPTEAQWEYACRAKTTTAYNIKDTISSDTEYLRFIYQGLVPNIGDTIRDYTGWYEDNSGGKTHHVGLKPINTWGLYDMHGNVYEWCWDWYGDYSDEAQTDPLGAFSGTKRVYRGGGFGSKDHVLRSAFRLKFNPNKRGHSTGFRIVRP